IRPAAYCGVIGYKPSFGEWSRVGIKLQAPSLDTLGVLCRSLDDAALMRAVLTGEARQVDRDAAAPRIGFCRTPAWGDADPATRALLGRPARRLADAGAKVTDFAVAPPFAGILETHQRIFEFEAARNYAFEHETRRSELSRPLLERLDRGRALPLQSYIEALE